MPSLFVLPDEAHSGLIFGLHRVCPQCKGKGHGKDYDKGQRRRELRIAKANGTEPPPINYGACVVCESRGYVEG
jgi:hypothetical protein